MSVMVESRLSGSR